MAIANIHVKVDPEIKAETEEILEQIGVSMSDLFNMTMRRVIIERRLPFDTTVPEIEMPREKSIDSLEKWQKLLNKRLAEDSGIRYSASEVREMLGLTRGAVTA